MSPRDPRSKPTLALEHAWPLVVALRERLRERGPFEKRTGARFDEHRALLEVEPTEAWVVVDPAAARGWSWPSDETPPRAVAELLDLYMPLVVGPGVETLVVAHLAQSLDGRIATHNGVSQFISGHEDLVHTHRLRALFDAVLVGSSTVVHDDPRLTTRMCEGESPVRVVIDPRGRVRGDRQLVREGRPTTLLVQRSDVPVPSGLASHVEVVTIPASEGTWLRPSAIIEALRGRGLRRIFIEGGGVTVSRFLQAGILDRLQVSVCPVVIGSGRPGITLPEVLDLDGALRLDARSFQLGRDILFDCPVPALADP